MCINIYLYSRFLSSPFIIRVPFFLIFSFNKGTRKQQKGQKGTTQEPSIYLIHTYGSIIELCWGLLRILLCMLMFRWFASPGLRGLRQNPGRPTCAATPSGFLHHATMLRCPVTWCIKPSVSIKGSSLLSCLQGLKQPVPPCRGLKSPMVHCSSDTMQTDWPLSRAT